MEAVITYIRGRPKETKLTYRRIEDNVVEQIVLHYDAHLHMKQISAPIQISLGQQSKGRVHTR